MDCSSRFEVRQRTGTGRAPNEIRISRNISLVCVCVCSVCAIVILEQLAISTCLIYIGVSVDMMCYCSIYTVLLYDVLLDSSYNSNRICIALVVFVLFLRIKENQPE